MEFLTQLGETAVAGCPRRVDDQQGRHAIGVRDGQLQGQVAAPRVPGHHGAVNAKGVQHGDGVRDVPLNRERAAGRRRAQAPLLIVDAAPSGHFRAEELHVVRDRGSAVQ